MEVNVGDGDSDMISGMTASSEFEDIRSSDRRSMLKYLTIYKIELVSKLYTLNLFNLRRYYSNLSFLLPLGSSSFFAIMFFSYVVLNHGISTITCKTRISKGLTITTL